MLQEVCHKKFLNLKLQPSSILCYIMSSSVLCLSLYYSGNQVQVQGEARIDVSQGGTERYKFTLMW